MCDRRTLREFRSDESATSVLEFAILGPLFLMLFLGVIGVGWSIFTVTTVNYAAERAGRVLLLNPSMSSEEVSAEVKSQVGYFEEDDLTVALAITTENGYRIGRATATYDFVLEVPLVGSYPISYSSTVSVPLI